MTTTSFSVGLHRGNLRREKKSARVGILATLHEEVLEAGADSDEHEAAWDGTGRRNRKSGRVQISGLWRKLGNLSLSSSTRSSGGTDDEDAMEDGDICAGSRQFKGEQLNYVTMQSSLAYGWLF